MRPSAFRSVQGLAFGVEFFFVLSGVVISLAHMRDIGRVYSFPSYLWKRFRRIYPIYWIVMAGWLCIYLGFGRNPDPRSREPIVILSSALLVHIGSLDTVLTVGWTLFHEVLFYAVFAVLIVNRRIGSGLLAAWMVGSLANGFVVFSPWFRDYWFSPLHLLFAYGLVITLLLRRGRVAFPRTLFAVGGAAFVSCVVAATWVGFTVVWLKQLAGLSAAVMLVGVMQLERERRLRVPPWLLFLGNASYSIYLVHMLVNVVIERPLYRIATAHGLGTLFCAVVMFAAGLLVGCLCHVHIERPLLAWMGAGAKIAHSPANAV